MAKAATTIRQALHYQPAHSSNIAATHDLYNLVAALFFASIAMHEQILELSNKESLSPWNSSPIQPKTTPVQECHSLELSLLTFLPCPLRNPSVSSVN